MPLLLYGRSQARDVLPVTADGEPTLPSRNMPDIERLRRLRDIEEQRQREVELMSRDINRLRLELPGQPTPEDTRLAAAQRRREQENSSTWPVRGFLSRPDSPIPNNNDDIGGGDTRPIIFADDVDDADDEQTTPAARRTPPARVAAYDYGVPISQVFIPTQQQPSNRNGLVGPMGRLQGHTANTSLASAQPPERNPLSPFLLVRPDIPQDGRNHYEAATTAQQGRYPYSQGTSARETPAAINNEAQLASMQARYQAARQNLRRGRSYSWYGVPEEPNTASTFPHYSPTPVIDEQLRDTYIALCEEYGLYVERYCRSLQWIVDATIVRDPSIARPTLDPLRNIGAHMLSKDMSCLNTAAQIYTAPIELYEEDFRWHEPPSTFPIAQDQAEIPMLGEFCWILNQADNVAWHMCIQVHTGCSTGQLLALRGIELRD
ncbi:hypothetical protein DL98DRAFT_611250 [Cadophora sp. DSE1049]|nr:hypothetical protein DL98DRAFT_611250 [Cadophora sp. DSE1049]